MIMPRMEMNERAILLFKLAFISCILKQYTTLNRSK